MEPLRVCIDRPRPDVQYVPGQARIALLRAKLFQTGTTLRVKFSASSTVAQRKEAQSSFEEIMRYANIDFRIATGTAKGDVRVTFDPSGGAWSYIGTDILTMPSNRATMNLGFNDAGTYLHEICHTLGAIHEHQNPKGGIRWNKEQVYRDLSGPPNHWDRETIDHNMFEAYSDDQLNGTEFDPKSIMLYAIPKSWTLDGFSSTPNSVLSPKDKAWLAKQYPGRFTPEPEEPSVIEIPLFKLRPTGYNIGQPGERDMYAFSVDTPGRVRIEAMGPTTVVMRLFGPNSKTDLIGQTNNVGLSPDFNARMDKNLNPGKYWVQVTHADPSGTGEYALRFIQFADNDTLLQSDESKGVVIRSPVAIVPGEYNLTRLGGI